MSECICESCFPNAKELGEMIPDYWLVQDGKRFALICQPGHSDSVVLTFPEKPWPDPDPECTQDENKDADRWLDVVCKWCESVTMPPETGYYLIESCIKSGWNPSGSRDALMWLFDYIGKLLQT